MEITLLLEFIERQQLRDWLQENHSSAKECWVIMSRKKSHWTELNKQRCQELESRGLMTQAGRDALNNAILR